MKALALAVAALIAVALLWIGAEMRYRGWVEAVRARRSHATRTRWPAL